LYDDPLTVPTALTRRGYKNKLLTSKSPSFKQYTKYRRMGFWLRELGKVERTLFLLQYISSPELRRRIHVGLNKGEAKNALARAVFFNRLGELRDRTHENSGIVQAG
jgi:TnpA family transposase